MDQRRVADGEHALVARLEGRVGVRAVVVLVDSRTFEGVLAGDAAGPDQHVVAHRVAFVEFDFVVFDAGHRRVGVDFDTVGFELVANRALELVVVAGEHVRRALDEVDVHLRAVLVGPRGHLAGDLNPRETATTDDHLCRVTPGGLAGSLREVLVDDERVTEALECQCIGFETVDAVEGCLAPETDDRVVVVDVLAVGEFHSTRVGVETGHGRLHERGLGRFDVLDRNRDRLARVGRADTTMALVEQEVIVLFGNPDKFGAVTEFVFEAADRRTAAVARAKDDDTVGHRSVGTHEWFETLSLDRGVSLAMSESFPAVQ